MSDPNVSKKFGCLVIAPASGDPRNVTHVVPLTNRSQPTIGGLLVAYEDTGGYGPQALMPFHLQISGQRKLCPKLEEGKEVYYEGYRIAYFADHAEADRYADKVRREVQTALMAGLSDARS